MIKDIKMNIIDTILEDVNIWDKCENEIIDIVINDFKKSKTQWLFENWNINVNNIEELVKYYLQNYTNYYED